MVVLKMFSNDKRSQLLLSAGIIITLSIISLSLISVSLSKIVLPIDKSTFIKPEFDNIRKEFGTALQDRLYGKLQYSEDLVHLYFNDTRDAFVFVEALHGYYFDAKYIKLTYNIDGPDGLIAMLTFSNGKEYICEQVEYDIDKMDYE
jgi:hypothetical protein